MKLIGHICGAASLIVAATLATAAPAWATDMKFASSTPPKAPWYKEMEEQAARIGENSGGSIKVELFPGGALGDEAKIVQGIRRGRIEAGMVSTAPLVTVVPEVGVLEIPFLWDSAEERDFVLDTYMLDAYRPLFEAAGLKLLAWSEVGTSSLSANRPVLTPKDAEGLRLRIPESQVANHYVSRLGATPVDIPNMEAVSALQTGLVDGIYTTTTALYFFGQYKNLTDVTLEESSYYAITHLVSKKWFDSLSDDEQAAVMDGAGRVSQPGRARMRDFSAQLTGLMAESGTTVHELSPEERAVWRHHVAGDAGQIVEMLGGSSKKIYEIVQEGKAAYTARSK